MWSSAHDSGAECVGVAARFADDWEIRPFRGRAGTSPSRRGGRRHRVSGGDDAPAARPLPRPPAADIIPAVEQHKQRLGFRPRRRSWGLDRAAPALPERSRAGGVHLTGEKPGGRAGACTPLAPHGPARAAGARGGRRPARKALQMLRLGVRRPALPAEAFPAPIVTIGLVMSLALLGDALLYVALPADASELGLPLWTVGVLLGANRLCGWSRTAWQQSCSRGSARAGRSWRSGSSRPSRRRCTASCRRSGRSCWPG